MKCIESVMYGVKCSSIEAHKNFPMHYGVWGGFLRRIIINLSPIKQNEINIFHSDVLNHVSYVGSYKRFLIFMGYTWKRLEMYFKLCFMVSFHHTKF